MADGSAAEEIVDLAYARTPSMNHTWKRNNGTTVSVSLQFSVSTEVGNELVAAQAAARNWSDAVAEFRAICEAADLFDEDSLIRCEDELRARLTGVLFADVDGHCAVERVIWDRLVWQ